MLAISRSTACAAHICCYGERLSSYISRRTRNVPAPTMLNCRAANITKISMAGPPCQPVTPRMLRGDGEPRVRSLREHPGSHRGARHSSLSARMFVLVSSRRVAFRCRGLENGSQLPVCNGQKGTCGSCEPHLTGIGKIVEMLLDASTDAAFSGLDIRTILLDIRGACTNSAVVPLHSP